MPVRRQVRGSVHAEKSTDQSPTLNSAAIVQSNDQASGRVINRGCQPERADRQQRRADRVEDRHAAAKHDARHDQKAAADAKKAGESADDQAMATRWTAIFGSNLSMISAMIVLLLGIEKRSGCADRGVQSVGRSCPSRLDYSCSYRVFSCIKSVSISSGKCCET